VVLRHARGRLTLILPDRVIVARYALDNGDMTLEVDSRNGRPHSFGGISSLKKGKPRKGVRGVWIASGMNDTQFLIVHLKTPVVSRPDPSAFLW